MDIQELLLHCVGFEWDRHNLMKNWDKHKVSFGECEEIFFNEPIFLERDMEHSKNEERFYAMGKTESERKLALVFTIRNRHIRVISARAMNRIERMAYENAEEKNT